MTTQPSGTDTPTGTDPEATYDQPGYEDKSLGQAVAQDEELVDELMAETGGDAEAAEREFRERSAGKPALDRQAGDGVEESVAAADEANGEPGSTTTSS